MKILRIILGIFGSLTALFAGGCGVFLLSIASPSSEGVAIISLLSFLPAALGGLLAWWAFKRRE